MNYRKTFTWAALFCVILATAAFIAGMFLPDSVSGNLMGFLKNYMGKIQFNFWGIFLNNLTAASVLFLGGLLAGIPSAFSLFFNFLALGAAYQFTRETIGTKTFLISVLPHGVFEIPAIMIACILGIVLGTGIFRAVFMKKGRELPDVIRKLVMIFLVIVIPLLAVAAFIEANLTLKLVQSLKS